MKTIRDEECRAALIERLNRLSCDAKPAWGKLSAEQMVSHLVQSHEIPFVASVPDTSNWMSRNVIKTLALYVMPIPKDVKTPAELDQQEKGRPPLGFEEDKARAIEGLNKLATVAADHPCLAHPFFGKLSAKQWGLLAHKHIDHHLRQFGV